MTIHATVPRATGRAGVPRGGGTGGHAPRPGRRSLRLISLVAERLTVCDNQEHPSVHPRVSGGCADEGALEPMPPFLLALMAVSLGVGHMATILLTPIGNAIIFGGQFLRFLEKTKSLVMKVTI